MYGKLTNNKLQYAPRNYNTGANLIINFNKNISLMKKYGFKEVIENKPQYDNSSQYLSVDGYVENEDNIIINYKINDIVVDDTPTLEDRVKELEEINKQQDKLINISLLATDEMFIMLEPLLTQALSTKSSNKMVNMYVAMVQRGLKKREEVPLTHRDEVIEILDKLELTR